MAISCSRECRKPLGERAQDRLLSVLPRADHERKAEPLAVGAVAGPKLLGLLRGELVQPRRRLLAGGKRAEHRFLRPAGPPGQDARGSARASPPRRPSSTVDTSARAAPASGGERPPRPGPLRDPRRTLEHRPAHGDEPSRSASFRSRSATVAHGRSASARTLTASAMCSIRLSSAGLWLIPSLLATNSIADGKERRQDRRVVKRPAGGVGKPQVEPARRFAQQIAHARVHRHDRAASPCAPARCASPRADAISHRPCPQALLPALQDGVRWGTEIDGERDPAGNDVQRVGLHLDPAHGDDRVVRVRSAALRPGTPGSAMHSAAPASASRRSSILVEPAWLAVPVEHARVLAPAVDGGHHGQRLAGAPQGQRPAPRALRRDRGSACAESRSAGEPARGPLRARRPRSR